MNSIANTEGRNYALYFARFVMAFLVVVIHVPCLGGDYLMPIARCAVPFFYIVSGDFLWKDSEEDFRSSCMRNAKKWLKLYIVSALILSIAAVVIKICYPQPLADFSWQQVYWLCFNGVYPSLERIELFGKTLGTTVVWFLYTGMITFIIAKLLYNFIKRRYFLIWCILLIVVSIIINRIYGGVLVPRLLSASVPFVLIGSWLRCHWKSYENKLPFIKLCVSVVLLYMVGGIEMKFFDGYKEMVFSTTFLSIVLILVALKSPYKFSFISHFPVKSTFDVYIYHRLMFVLLVIAGWNSISGLSAVVVYAVCLAISVLIRKMC